MNEYEKNAIQDMWKWRIKITQKQTAFKRIANVTQTKMNTFIPEKVHTVITEAIKKMTETVLTGSKFLTKHEDVRHLSLEQQETLVKEQIISYRKVATLEGAGTGAGGIVVGLADFPLLLSIKIKFLFHVAALYGHNVQNYSERLFILYVFQLAYSDEKQRKNILPIIETWDKTEHPEIDWQTFQQQYRDHIDLVKMLQLVPWIGAAVGAYANYQLLDHLGETAMNCYRLRKFPQK